MSDLKQSSVALLEEAINRKIRNAQTEIERADVIKAAKAKNSGAANAPTA